MNRFIKDALFIGFSVIIDKILESKIDVPNNKINTNNGRLITMDDLNRIRYQKKIEKYKRLRNK